MSIADYLNYLKSTDELLKALGTVLGAGAAVWGWWKFVWSRKKSRDDVAALVTAGDRFSESAAIEGDGHERALKQYRKAFARDRDNFGIFRRIVKATRHKLELEAWSRPFMSRESRAEIESVLARLYEFQAGAAALKSDKDLLLDEAALLRLAGKADSAFAVLRRAHESLPEDPDVLAALGDMANDVELLRGAIARCPSAAYHRLLARALDAHGRKGEAIREYRKAAELATGPDIATRRTYHGALHDMLGVFKSLGEAQGGVLGPQLGLPLEERVEALEALVASGSTKDRACHYFLATLYLARSDFGNAHRAVLAALGDDKGSWRYQLPMVRLLARILEESGLDAAQLAEAQAILQADTERKLYEETLEAAREENGHMYKVGLRVERAAGDGVHVLRSYEGYPFAKAGVRDGDRILEFAHRKIRSLRDIRLRLVQFAPGTDVPIKVQRAGDLIDLTLIIQ
jgi:tetratricopeptide (TPR) repeat protein